MPDPQWYQRLAEQLARLDAAKLRRRRQTLTPIDAAHVRLDGLTYVNFASNDYLGLSRHPHVAEAATRAIERFGVGSGAAPLITGYTDAHASAESAIARWKGTEAAVLFSSGYQANVAVIQMVSAAGRESGRAVRFLLDKLCHASLIDAVRGASVDNEISFRVFPHNGMTKLARLLDDRQDRQDDVVVTESIFSMDGDAADLPGITTTMAGRNALLVVDEAHGSGVYGQHGAGWCSHVGLADRVDITIVTLSKALGCIGAAVCGSKKLCDALLNFGRSYIFSTSMPAAVAAAAEAAIDVLRDEPLRQARVRSLARQVRDESRRAGLNLPANDNPDDAPIVPILLGTESAAIEAAQQLRQRGLLALAIRPPTVPRSGSRLRVTLSCEHSDGEVESLVRELRSLRA